MVRRCHPDEHEVSRWHCTGDEALDQIADRSRHVEKRWLHPLAGKLPFI